MAYAALRSLERTIDGLLESPRISVASSTRQILQSAIDHALSLRQTLTRCREGVSDIDERIIIEEACKLEDAIEFPISTHFLLHVCPPTFSFNLDQLTQHLDCFAETAKKMEQNMEESWDQKVRKMIEENIEELFQQKTEKEKEEVDYSSPTPTPTHMVGLSDQFRTIRDHLTSQSSLGLFYQNQIAWISGMAGIGKTTLAKRIFHDPSVMENFKCRAFVRVGRECWVKEILQAIISQLNLDNEEMIMEGDEDLLQCFSRILTVRKSLVVLDDVWEDTSIFALIEKGIEDPESRILVTSRTDPDSFYFSNYFHFCNYNMRFLNEEESWEVLRRNVFGEEEEECPKELVEAGKKIADKCGGLPLLIIAVADQLISKVKKTPECWKRVADKPNSILEDACDQISEVLLSSYHPLTEIEKLCFHYFVAFPLNYIVWSSNIASLCCAEGFISYREFSFYNSLQLLLQINLVIGHKKGWHRVITKAFSLHCAYWYVSKRVAKDNKLLYIINSYADGLDECVESHHRLAIHNNVLLAIKEVHNKIASISTVRFLLCTGPYHQYQVPICPELKLLRVLDALTIRFYEFPIEVVKLIRLRYLALTCNANLPRSISKLWNLQFLIVHQHLSIKRVAVEKTYVPAEIWDMQELIHLEIMGRNLPDPPTGSVLPNLIKLLDVGVHSCTKRVLESMPYLKKLKIQIDLAPDAAETLSLFRHISRLHKLESLKSVIKNPTLLRPPPLLSFSASYLRKLSLSGFGYPWEYTSKIAELPELEVLKLQCYAFRGEKWDAKEMRFLRLQHLLIEDTDLVQWTATDETFPQIFHLTMKNCHKLQQIPQISAMDFIELVDCNPLAETSARQRYDAKWVKVRASYSWKEEKLKS